MVMKYGRRLSVVALFILVSWNVYAQGDMPSQKIHSPAEIVKLTENSPLVYQIKELKTPVSQVRAGEALSNQLFIEASGGTNNLQQYSLSKEANDILKKAENAFQGKQYDEALKLYQSVLGLEPSYSYIYTLIGDVFFTQGDYKQAQVNFEQAIQQNFIDYQAHWFLADTLWKLGEKERAVTEITIAHLLNVNHSEIKKVLKGYRNETQRPWQEWEFNPQYSFEKDGEQVVISVSTDWLGYALVKALWKYEPGYAEKMVGSDYKNQVVCFLEEKEALASFLAGKGSFKNLENIIKGGLVNEMILYEMVAPKGPQSIVLLPRESFMKVVEYIDKFH